MISFNFNIRNPWSDKFENLWNCVFTTPFDHKVVELEITNDFTLLSFHFNYTIRQSHAGLEFELGMFGYCLMFHFYDTRHWDKDTGTWEDHD
jgi:hypothetical protein